MWNSNQLLDVLIKIDNTLRQTLSLITDLSLIYLTEFALNNSFTKKLQRKDIKKNPK